jgi:hypothetical protein
MSHKIHISSTNNNCLRLKAKYILHFMSAEREIRLGMQSDLLQILPDHALRRCDHPRFTNVARKENVSTPAGLCRVAIDRRDVTSLAGNRTRPPATPPNPLPLQHLPHPTSDIRHPTYHIQSPTSHLPQPTSNIPTSRLPHTHPHEQIPHSLYTTCYSMKHHPEAIHYTGAMYFENMKICKYANMKR